MAGFSTKCATTASLLALATLPGDRALFDAPITHEDFPSARGYLRRSVDGGVVHALDWDGNPGVEAILRENGRRSAGLWREFRAWHSSHGGAGVAEAGNTACALLCKHFGPYHHGTSEALSQRRSLERERTQAARTLEKECPLALRLAARDYLSRHFGYLVKIPTPYPFVAETLPNAVEVPTGVLSSETRYEPPLGSIFSHSESVIREFMLTTPFLTNATSVEDAAKSVVAKITPLEENLDVLDITRAVFRLPQIPGERQPADIDLIEYGALICRHRAVVVAVLLADAGFDVEVVEGAVVREGFSGAHLFVYRDGKGILEPSADGPSYWRSTTSTSRENNALLITVEGDLTYRFGVRTPLRRPGPPL